MEINSKEFVESVETQMKAIRAVEGNAYKAGYIKGFTDAKLQYENADSKAEMAEREDPKEIEQLIGYAVKEGYLDVDKAQSMSEKEKVAYYEKSMAYSPDANE